MSLEKTTLPHLRQGENIVSQRMGCGSVVFLFSPLPFRFQLARRCLVHSSNTLVYKCQASPDIGSIHLPLNGTLYIITNEQVLWFQGDKSWEYPYSAWYRSDYRVMYTFTVDVFGESAQLAEDLFDDYFCKINGLPSRHQANEVPSLLAKALEHEKQEAVRLLKTLARDQPLKEAIDIPGEEHETNIKRASAIWCARYSKLDMWDQIEMASSAEDTMHGSDPHASTFTLRSDKQRHTTSTFRSSKTTDRPAGDIDESVDEGPGPTIVDGRIEDDGGELEHSFTSSSKPLVHSTATSISTTDKRVQDCQDGQPQEPVGNFRAEENKGDDFGVERNLDREEDEPVQCNTTPPISFCVHEKQPSPEKPNSWPWRKIRSLLLPCFYGDIDDDEKADEGSTPGIMVEVTETRMVEYSAPAQDTEQMVMKAEQESEVERSEAPPKKLEDKAVGPAFDRSNWL